MKAIKLTLFAGAAFAAAGAAIAQPAAPEPMTAPVTREQAAQRADARFQQMDTNRDGRVTSDERRAPADGRMAQRQERLAERQTQMFDRLDTDRNGQLSREEFGQRMAMRGGGRGEGRRGGGRGGERMDGDMRAGGGELTAEQFRTRALERFDRLDTNRDGRIGPEEQRGRGGRGRR